MVIGFAVDTGWRYTSRYPPLDAGIKSSLQAYFAPLSALLFRYLGIEPYTDWAYDTLGGAQ